MKALQDMLKSEVTESGNTQEVDAKNLLRLEMLTSFEKYTKAMFRAQYHKSFIVAEHHKQIFQALQDVVDCKCKRLIINLPPRYGKCSYKDEKVLTTEGLKYVKDIIPGDKVFSFKSGKAVINQVLAVEPAYKSSIKLTMRSGRTFTASSDHPMLTPFGWQELRDMAPGTRIAALKAEIDSSYEIPDEELLLATLLIFEGCLTNPADIRFATTDPLVLKAAKAAAEYYGCRIKQFPGYKSFEYNISGGASGGVGQMLVRNGLSGHYSYDKRLPASWFALSMRQKYMFIDMMVATDGCIAQNTGQIIIGLANKGLIEDIQYLLATMGIACTFTHKSNSGAGSWELAIPRQYAQKLYPHLTFYSKAEQAKAIIDKPGQSLIDTYPFEIIRREHLTGRTRKAGIRCQPHKNITADKFKRLVGIFPQLRKYYTEDFWWDEVITAEEVGPRELVHLEVENEHNYIVNGLVSHNTEIAIKSFISWCFALNPKCRFLHLSYSDMLVNDNSDTIRSIMMEPLYKSLFPGSALASEKGSSKRWKTKAGGELYAVSTQGQVTGFGAGQVDSADSEGSDMLALTGDQELDGLLNTIGATRRIFQGAILIDDPMKPEDADSDIVRERINMRFENTIRNRTNSRDTPIIIIMQRLHEHDLCGYLKEIEPGEWRVLALPAIQENPDTHEQWALWPMKHTLEELIKMREINPLVFDTQYMQDPTPKEGLMYSEGFRTYAKEMLPSGRAAYQKWNYTDTADTGADFHCSICFINTPEFIYITDVLFTDAPMEITEPKQADMLTLNQTVESLIESNNGGRGFARNVKRLLRTKLRNFRCVIKSFTQTQNKKTRIYTYSAQVQNDILFPEGWDKKWPKFYNALMSYRKDNKKRNQHDDAPDALTGVYEMHSRKAIHRGIRRRN